MRKASWLSSGSVRSSGRQRLTKIYTVLCALVIAGCAPDASASDRIGLVCTGEVQLPNGVEGSFAEEHYIVDPDKGQLVHRDPFSGEAITTYNLTVEPRQYRGERQEDGRTNGGLNVHHYETVHISRETGSITSSSLSTTTFPNGPSTTEIRFEGHCTSEDPDELDSLKF